MPAAISIRTAATTRVSTLPILAASVGPSGYNQPLNDILSVVYDLPYGKGRTFGANAPMLMQQVLGGWQITAINSISSGQPVNITYSPSNAQTVSTILNQRPNQISKNAVLPKSQRTKGSNNTVLLALNSAAFSLPGNNHPYGTAGRNSVRFDPYYNTDIGPAQGLPSLSGEGVTFDFRAEAFNIFNQTNYALPGNGLCFQHIRRSLGIIHLPGTSPGSSPAKIVF